VLEAMKFMTKNLMYKVNISDVKTSKIQVEI